MPRRLATNLASGHQSVRRYRPHLSYAVRMEVARRKTPSPVFMVLLIPFGVSSGYVSVTLAFLLSHAGMRTDRKSVV